MMNNQFCGNDKNHTDEEAETNKTGCERRSADYCTDTTLDLFFVLSITFVFFSLLLLWILFEHISSTRNNTSIVVIIVVVIIIIIIIIIWCGPI